MFKKQVILMLVLSLVLLSCGGAVIQRDPFKDASTTLLNQAIGPTSRSIMMKSEIGHQAK